MSDFADEAVFWVALALIGFGLVSIVLAVAERLS